MTLDFAIMTMLVIETTSIIIATASNSGTAFEDIGNDTIESLGLCGRWQDKTDF